MTFISTDIPNIQIPVYSYYPTWDIIENVSDGCQAGSLSAKHQSLTDGKVGNIAWMPLYDLKM